ncbi:MAG: ADP-forming succinate--CoA ligase subunit beta [Acidimicrobiales bacterium]
MDLLEYQGKAFLARFGIPVPAGGPAGTVAEALAEADRAGYPVVVKAQVQVGGRGKAGGVRLAAGADEVRAHAGGILGMEIKGHLVRQVWVEHASRVVAEYYASFTIDRGAGAHLGMVSARGGVEIETVAAAEPAAVARVSIDPTAGFGEDQGAELAERAGLDPAARPAAAALLAALYRAYVEGDADLVEVNPLALTAAGDLVALDAKVTLDDNAAYRHPEWSGWAGEGPADEREHVAHSLGLQYVGLDGYVGVVANGAGLAMATCDVVNQVGGAPANFLDIGGGASAEVMANALRVVNSDPRVRAILVNIFGGITRGEDVANGIVAALARTAITTPLVVRLDGTNAAEGRAILASVESARVVSSPTMLGAARRAVELAGPPAGAR